MRKISIGTTLALALTLGASSIAAAQGGNHPERPRAAQDSTLRRGPAGPDAMLLRGITLSPDQQARVAALRPSRRPERMDSGRVRGGRGSGDAASARAPRAPRARGDTAGMGARRAQMERQHEQHVAALRAILTADQRTQFDRNVAELKARRAERGSAGARGASGDRRPRMERPRTKGDGRPPFRASDAR